MGLLTSTRSADYAYRVYDTAAVKRPEQILILRKLNISIKDIQHIFAVSGSEVVLEVLGRKVDAIASEHNNTGDYVMPLSYCYCCAGSVHRHLQLQLSVELKTKEIISSPINSRGEKPCGIIFEIV